MFFKKHIDYIRDTLTFCIIIWLVYTCIATWILHHFRPLRQLNILDKQDLMARIYELLNKTAPAFSRKDKENMISLLKQRLKTKVVDPVKMKQTILNLIFFT